MNIKLQDYQKNIINHINKTDKKGLLLYHNILDDTIMTSLLSSITILEKKKMNISKKMTKTTGKDILIITSSINIFRYIKYIKDLKLDLKNFEFLNYKQFNNFTRANSNYCKNKIVVLDKVHYYRIPNLYTHSIIEALSKSYFNILTTTFLFINNLEDIITVIAILHRINWKDAKELFLNSKNSEYKFKLIFQGFVSYHTLTPSEQKLQLKLYENIIQLKMDEIEQLEYSKIEHKFLELKNSEEYKDNNLKYISDFNSDIKKNIVHSSKHKWILTKIQENVELGEKTIIYLNRETQDENLILLLQENNIRFIQIASSMKYDQQKDLVNKFNNLQKQSVLILYKLNTDISYFLPNIRTLIVEEPQINSLEVLSIIDDIYSSFKYKKKSSSGKKGSLTKRLDIFTLVSKKVSFKKPGILSLLKGFFYGTDNKTVDEMIQSKNESNKLSIKNFRKKLRHYSI